MKYLLLLSFTLFFSFSGFNQKINKKKVVEVNGIRGKYDVKVGQIVAYTGSNHSSVGISFYISEDNKYLKFLKKETEYEQDQEHAGNGGDAAWVTYYYEVIEVGETKINIKEDFRGDTKAEFDIKLTITAE
jgi:predicted secreted protein